MKKNSQLSTHNSQLTIGWLYPRLMSTYGDRGNIITLSKRCQWRGIAVEVRKLDLGFKINDLKKCDLLFMGGAQDRQQTIVAQDLGHKGKLLKQQIEAGIPGLYICGAYQFLGKYYKEADGTKIDCLNIFDLYTVNPGKKSKRLIGNMIFNSKLSVPIKSESALSSQLKIIVGFENHGGRTYLGKNMQPLGKVIKGFGNNGEDGTEGAIYKNSLGTYSHGPILPKNPQLADWLITKALETKYKRTIKLESLDDSLEEQARVAMLKRIK